MACTSINCAFWSSLLSPWYSAWLASTLSHYVLCRVAYITRQYPRPHDCGVGRSTIIGQTMTRVLGLHAALHEIDHVLLTKHLMLRSLRGSLWLATRGTLPRKYFVLSYFGWGATDILHPSCGYLDGVLLCIVYGSSLTHASRSAPLKVLDMPDI